MNKLSIIILREFTTRVTKKSFILMTVLMPFLFAALVFVPMWLGQINGDEQEKIVVIDPTNHYFPCLESNDQYLFVRADKMDEGFKSDTSDVAAVLQITDDLVLNPKAVTLASRKELQLNMIQYIEGALDSQVRKDKLESYNIPELDNIVSDLESNFTISTVKWNADGEETFSSSDIAMVFGLLATFLIYMFVMSYGGMVMAGVTEEKTNRIMEIMVSSVKPFQLMMGKIVGVALVGFTQMLIWGIMLAGIITGAVYFLGGDIMSEATAASTAMSGGATGGLDAASVEAMAANSENAEIINALLGLPYAEIAIMFVLMFIGGYLLYASFFAAVGASVNSQEDSSQFMMPVVILMVFGMYAAMGSIGNTDGPLAFWSSLFPLTSPIVMMVRIPFGVPLWQEILCVVLLFATALGMVWVAAKIYRVGILMYGKKPTVKEMLKWLRYN